MNKFEQTIALFSKQMESLKEALKFSTEVVKTVDLASQTLDVTDETGNAVTVTVDKLEIGGMVRLADGTVAPDGEYTSADGSKMTVVSGAITELASAQEEATPNGTAAPTGMTAEEKISAIEATLESLTDVLTQVATSVTELANQAKENQSANTKLSSELVELNKVLDTVTLGNKPEKFEKQNQPTNVYENLAKVFSKKS